MVPKNGVSPIIKAFRRASYSAELIIPEDQHPCVWVRPGLSRSATANPPKMTESGVQSNSKLVYLLRLYN